LLASHDTDVFRALPASTFWPFDLPLETFAAITHNLLRTAGTLARAFHAKARGVALRRDLIRLPARIARHHRGHLTFAPAWAPALGARLAGTVQHRSSTTGSSGLTSPNNSHRTPGRPPQSPIASPITCEPVDKRHNQ
jgi:hypothetical protein